MTLEAITVDEFGGLKHGFFTRIGGVSEGIYGGLNAGLGSSDNRDNVLENRRLITASLGLDAKALQSVHQIHSADVVSLDQPLAEAPKADAMVTATPGLALGILTADCQPVLFADTKNHVIGAAHAGWKGARSGVLQNTVEAMVNLGAERESIDAVIGPSISQRAYEVGPEFFDEFMGYNADFARLFAQGEGDRMMFDLPGFGLWCLRDAGVEARWTGHCTYNDEARFFSYRRTTHRAEPDYGRLLSVISL